MYTSQVILYWRLHFAVDGDNCSISEGKVIVTCVSWITHHVRRKLLSRIESNESWSLSADNFTVVNFFLISWRSFRSVPGSLGHYCTTKCQMLTNFWYFQFRVLLKYDEASGKKKFFSDRFSTSPNPRHTHMMMTHIQRTHEIMEIIFAKILNTPCCACVWFWDWDFDRCPEGYLVLKIKNVHAN